MACMEHSCTQCDWYGCDNQKVYECPKCGGRTTNQFDEEGMGRSDPEPKEEREW